MKKALKKILALVATGAMAISAFAMSASAAQNVSWCDYHRDLDHCYLNGYYYEDINVSLIANNWKNGTITAQVSKPSNVTITNYAWTGTGINTTSNAVTTTINNSADTFNATCTVTYQYTVNVYPNRTETRTGTVSVSLSSNHVYSTEGDARANGGRYATLSSNNGVYYPGYIYDDDIVYYAGNYYYYWQCYRDNNGNWVPKYGETPIDWYDYNHPSYVVPSRYDYEVDWDTDTFYYNGRKQVPTATVTIGKRTIELDVRIIAGDKDSTDVGSYRASASLPSGYRGYKLSGSTIRYTIEEPLKQGLVNENGGVYYYTNGKAATGWKTIGNDTYYFGKDGKATVGWIKLEGKWYYFDTAGIMQTGWVRSGGKTYYTNASGVMVASKWMKLDGYWYYFGETGAMVESGWVQTGGKWYYLSADGKMATNTTIPGGYRVDANGVWVK